MNILGILVVVLGGVLSGLFTAPLAYIKGWQWENSWLIYTIYAMVRRWCLNLALIAKFNTHDHIPLFPQVLFPWIFAFFALEDLPNIYSDAPAHAIIMALVRRLSELFPCFLLYHDGCQVFGFLWGIGSVTFGLG